MEIASVGPGNVHLSMQFRAIRRLIAAKLTGEPLERGRQAVELLGLGRAERFDLLLQGGRLISEVIHHLDQLQDHFALRGDDLF